MAKTKLIGEDAMIRKMRAIAKKFPDAVMRELFQFAEIDIMTPAKREYVPVGRDQGGGVLRDSGFVAPPKRGKGTMIQVEMFFGGAASPYALAIHEHPSQFDPPSWKGATGDSRSGAFSGQVRFTVGGPKYLELPMMAVVPSMARTLGKRIMLERIVK